MMMYKTKTIMSLPSPVNINMWWNMGSMLGICLMTQISSGIILSMNYCPNIELAFSSIIKINNNNHSGWIIRNIHVNGASMLFMLMFTHIIRGVYFTSFKNKLTWTLGIMILLTGMMSAFLGYVLPWGQMSYWGATVITNLMSAIPWVGTTLVYWIWGGLSINNSTLNRFYTLHFLMPLIMSILVLSHLMTLHKNGSTNPMGIISKIYMIPFNPYFNLKDMVGFMIMFMVLLTLSTQAPTMMMDPDNFSEANPLITPPHIKPEWYFLFAYSILRSIPNKLGGVICLMMSITLLLTFPMIKLPNTSMKFNPIMQSMFYLFMISSSLLTWTGGCPIEHPYMLLAQISSMCYFSFFLMLPMSPNLTEKFDLLMGSFI